MTMADTVAVMNAGVIEQMGAPRELYELPRTTFVANFLGQSNLLRAEIIDGAGDVVTVDCHGQKIGVGASRVHTRSGACWLGVRPEKVVVSRSGEARGGANELTGGRISDVSFVGVSTQYLVAMPWGQEIMVFEQNTGQRAPFRNGDEVDLAWSRGHAFLLDAGQDAHAGMVTPEDDV
jgi:spermidine/putrescine transport system ATP-binding protein